MTNPKDYFVKISKEYFSMTGHNDPNDTDKHNTQVKKDLMTLIIFECPLR